MILITSISLQTKINALKQGSASANFCIKGQIVSPVGCVGHMISVATTQLCHGIKKTAINIIHSSQDMETALVCINENKYIYIYICVCVYIYI